MKTFGEHTSEKIITFDAPLRPAGKKGIDKSRIERLGVERFATPAAPFVARTAEGTLVSDDQLADQFLLFQWNAEASGPRILSSNRVQPGLKGDRPDVLAKAELLSFHLADSEKIKPNEKAIMRIDFGQDEKSNSNLDRVTYSILAGLDLYNQAKNEKSKPAELQSDFSQAFAKRPIEIAGGLAKIRFELCKLPEPKWWQKIFRWLKSDSAKALTAALGFPGLTPQAVGVVDDLINGLLGTDEPEVLFRSRAMTLALSEAAKSDFTGNIPGIEIGGLRPGICLMARGRDYGLILSQNPIYRGDLGLLVPNGVTDEELLSSRFVNPFAELSYGVLKIRLSETTISPF